MRKYSCRSPSSENAVAVKTMKTLWVSPKMAGIESRAKRMSVPPMAAITSSIGVITRRPFSTVNSLSPSYVSVVWNRLRASRIMMLSAEWLSSPSGLSMFPAVSSRTRPNR